MKISQIKISKFHQFEDFELDLTYPKGHEKEGQPLDKVCFIGQSGTGKTTLLEMIREICINGSVSHQHEFEFEKGYGATFSIKSEDGADYIYILLASGGVSGTTKDVNALVKSLLYFPAGIASINLFKNGTFDKAETNPINFGAKNIEFSLLDKSKLQEIWNRLNNVLVAYQIEEANLRISLTHKIEKEEIGVNIRKEIEDWKKNHPNPVEIVARECLDSILNKFHLAVKTEIDDTRQVNALQIRSLVNNTTIPYEHLSTGTKQIIFTAFPIYQLIEDDSIILMDEPETSLYPDIQREIIPYYTSFDKEKKSQFFFATHSPIIASSFEPWEIVELKFDEKGKVYRDKYYEGENHVDNYKIDPRYLRWDEILTKVFDLPVDSNAEFRSKKLMEYAILKEKIQKLRAEGSLKNPSKEVQKVVDEFQKAYDLITGNWAVTRHEKN